MDDEATNQVADDGATLVDTEAATGVEAGDEQQFDDEGNVIEAPAEDEEELDIHGHKVKLPKSAAEKLAAERLMQADYTRKTQELADTRKAFEAERSQLQQADAEVLTARANLNIIDRQIAEFGKVNFSAWMQQATAAYDEDEKARCQAAFMQYQNLKDAKAQTQNYLSAYQQDQTLKQQQETAKLREQAAAEISREIPDWSPAKAAQIMEETTKSYGYTPTTSDRFWRLTPAPCASFAMRSHGGITRRRRRRRKPSRSSRKFSRPPRHRAGATLFRRGSWMIDCPLKSGTGAATPRSQSKGVRPQPIRSP
jgi:hypothetical protein